MTKEEALQQAAEEIQKKEQHEFATKELAGKINSGTNEIVKNQRDNKVKELQEQQEAYVKVYKKENPVIAQEINDILGLSAKEGTQKNTLDGVINAIEFSNKVDQTRAAFTDEGSKNAFNRGVKQVGAEVFMAAYEKAGNNVFQALAEVNGCKDIIELIQQDERKEKEKKNILNPDKDSEMIEKIAQRVAEILKQK